MQLVFITVSAANSIPNDVIFYEMGESTCPHCSALHNLFVQNFPNNTYFCDIATSQDCLVRFYSWINISSFPLSVPQTFVVYNRTYILAIVIGEVENVTFWTNLANSAPNETRFPVYYGDQLAGYINANQTIQQYIIDTFLYPSQATTSSPPTNTTTQAITQNTENIINSKSIIITLVITVLAVCFISLYVLKHNRNR